MEFIHREGDHLPGLDELRTTARAPGEDRLVAQVHRLRFALEGLDDELQGSAAAVFENFTESDFDGADTCIRVDFRLAERETFLAFRTTPEPERYRILVTRHGDNYRFVSYHFAAHYRPAEREVRVVLARGPGRHKERLVDNFFRVLASYAFIEEGTVLVHAAALVRDGQGYLFIGPSGSGKTTVSRLSLESGAPVELLSDDQGLVSVEDDRVLLSGTPFRGGERIHSERHPDALPGPNLNRTVPLRGLYRLVQADRVEVQEMPSALQISDLMSAVPIFPGEPYNNERLLGTLERIIERVPARRLLFRKDDSFWSAITD